MEININHSLSSEQECEHTQGQTFESDDLQLQRSFHPMTFQEPANLEQFICNMFEDMKAKF
jgi:hypothetical protein